MGSWEAVIWRDLQVTAEGLSKEALRLGVGALSKLWADRSRERSRTLILALSLRDPSIVVIVC